MKLIKPNDLTSVPLSNDDQQDPQLFELVWFLLFLGVATDTIADNLRALRDSRGSRSHSTNLSDNKGTVTYLHTKWNKQFSSTQNVRLPPYVRKSAPAPTLVNSLVYVAKAPEEYIEMSIQDPRMPNIP